MDKDMMLTNMIHRYGFEHTKVITFAWYVENADTATCEKIYNQLMA